MSCKYCEIIEGKKEAFTVYEDDDVMAILENEGATEGHIKVFPKKHHNQLEDIPESIVDHLFFVASVSSSVMFEAMGLGGTNIISNNLGDNNHITVDVIPRRQNDGLDFLWKPKQFDEMTMQNAQNKISDKTFMISYKPKKKTTIDLNGGKPDGMSQEKYDYYMKQLKNIM